MKREGIAAFKGMIGVAKLMFTVLDVVKMVDEKGW